MNKKLQVFVSSTYTDLKEERQAAVEAILDAGHIPAGMELFKAGNESQLKTIYKWIDESDVYMLILGGRYGSIENKSGKSYIQLEYEYALSKGIPVFAVVLSDSFLTQKITSLGLKNVTEQFAPTKFQSFKYLVMSKIVREVDDCKDIKIAIHSTLNIFVNEYTLLGWTRNSNENNEKTQQINIHQQNEWKSLKKENQSLKEIAESLKKENQSLKKTYESLKDEYQSFKKTEKLNLLEIMEYVNKKLNIFSEPNFKTNNIIPKNENVVNLTEETYKNIKTQLQNKNFLITLNPHENKQKTAIQDCFTIFLNNYYLLENGVLPSNIKWQTGLLYAHVCPFLETYNLVDKIKDVSYGFIYKISTTGIAFYRMSITMETSN